MTEPIRRRDRRAIAWKYPSGLGNLAAKTGEPRSMPSKSRAMRKVGGSLTAASALAALLTLAGPAAARQASAPTLTVSLAPAAPDAKGEIGFVDVMVTSSFETAKAGEPLLRLALVSSNVQTTAKDLIGLQASDAAGPLALTATDDGAERRWSADRAVAGPITVRYRAPITNAPNPRGAAPPFELRSEGGGFSAAGVSFLVLPKTEVPHQLAVRWTLPAGAVALSSLGPGDSHGDKPEPVSRLDSAFFMGGALGLYPRVTPRAGFFSAWQGQPPFDADAVMTWTQGLYGDYLKIFRAQGNPPFGVFLRGNPINPGGGVELAGSFVGTFGPKTEAEDLKITLAHEMVHTFVGALDGDDLAASWFSEGLAVFYERALPLRAGKISTDAFLRDLNSTAGRYYTNALIAAPNSEIPARFWADTRIRVLPYDRGAMYFAVVDDQIRKYSGGKRSLDDLVLAMLARRQQGQSVNEAAWVALLRGELGEPGVAQFEAMKAGATQLPAPDAFGPCFTRTTKLLRRYLLGFEPVVLTEPQRIVRGLIPGSAAEKAGLRDGDQITRPVPQDGVQGDQAATLTLQVKRGDQDLTLTYLPRGETVPAYQWVRAPRQGGACKA
jgi:predicted metalloprotease with PDZ domain